MARNPRSGQSLIDVLVASAVGAILLVGALSVLSPALRGGADAEMAQTGASLARGMQDAVRSAAASNWNSVASLAQGTNNRYYVQYNASGTASFATGTESVASASTFSSLFGYWHFNEGTGTVSVGSNASSSLATLANGAAWASTSTCHSGSCLYLDGANDYAGVTVAVPEDPYTASLWFKTLDANGGFLQADASRLDPSTYDRSLIMNGGSICGIFGGENSCTTGANYADGRWHHLAYVIGGAGATQAIYVDGNLQPLNTVVASSESGSLTGFTIGYSSETSSYLQGHIDDVQVYSLALTPTQVKLLAMGTYSRSFYIEPVYRNSSGGVVNSGGYLDPSTLQLVVSYQWPRGAARTITTYLTRSRSQSTVQRDWTGGSGQAGPVTDPGNRYDTGSNITVDVAAGSFQIPL